MSDKTASWKDKLTFLEPDGVEHDVGGQAIMFYPVSLGTLFEIKVIGAPLAKALSVLFDDKGRDYGTVSRNFHTPDGQNMDSEIIVEARTPEMATLRAKQRQESIEKLMEALLNDKAKKAVGKIIIESMKDKFDQGQVPPALEFMNEIPATSIVEFLTGVAKANKGVLGPLAESLTGLWAKAKTKMDQALSDESVIDDAASSPIADTEPSEEAKGSEQAA